MMTGRPPRGFTIIVLLLQTFGTVLTVLLCFLLRGVMVMCVEISPRQQVGQGVAS